jgi:hypothetical protein
MYKIDRTSYGLFIVLGGSLEEGEIKRYFSELRSVLTTVEGPFSAIIDVRTAVPSRPEVLRLFLEQLQWSKNTPCQRLAILGKSPVIKGQAIQLMFQSEMTESIRYFDTSKAANWEKICLDWVVKGIEPDYEAMPSPDRAQVPKG